MTDHKKLAKSSLRNNIIIAFFLLIIGAGIAFTTIYNQLFLSVVKQAVISPDIVEEIGRDFTVVGTGISIIGIMLACLIAIVISKSITRPIQTLTRGVELISQGNLDVRIQIDSQDEFGRLAEEFNNMVELRKQADDILHQKIEELRRSNAELERYASVASHDLQEPLRIVINYLQILSNKYKDKLDEEARHCIDRSMHNANRMSQLIKDLLLYSHAGMHDRPFESVDCNRILEQVLVLLKPSIKENNALIEYNKLPTITADAMQMSQLFQNLIANSLKFRTKKAPHIHISTKREGEYIIFSLRDNGIGIDERYADKIFSMFARLHTHQEYPGTGIGLAICKKIVDHHGGKIWIEAPKNGCGTIFHFSIPVNPVKFPAQET